MPSSAVRTFTDPDDYAATIRAGTVELTVIGRGDFNAKLIRVDLNRLWIQRYSENLPRIWKAASIGGRAIISFRTDPGPSLFTGGWEMQPSTMLRHSLAYSFFQRSSGPANFGSISLPIEDIASVGATVAGLDLAPPSDAALITPSPAAMAKLQRLHAAAGDLAENAPEIIANPNAARGLEQALIEAMVGCLGYQQQSDHSLARGQHAIVMRRFYKFVEQNPEEPLYIPEICEMIGVPGRTLRLCCQEYLGMGPKRYLLLRRMHFAWRALRQAVPEATSVTEIATRYGFWQLGQFAINYQSLFGESPSATLRRQST